jgi:hypothetical protein
MQFPTIANLTDDQPPCLALGTPGVAGDTEARSFEIKEGESTISLNAFGEVVSGWPDESSVSSRSCKSKTRSIHQVVESVRICPRTWYTMSKLSLRVATLTTPK